MTGNDKRPVASQLTFVNADHNDGEELRVDFSDGTSAIFKAEELAALRPERVAWEFGEE